MYDTIIGDPPFLAENIFDIMLQCEFHAFLQMLPAVYLKNLGWYIKQNNPTLIRLYQPSIQIVIKK